MRPVDVKESVPKFGGDPLMTHYTKRKKDAWKWLVQVFIDNAFHIRYRYVLLLSSSATLHQLIW